MSEHWQRTGFNEKTGVGWAEAGSLGRITYNESGNDAAVIVVIPKIQVKAAFWRWLPGLGHHKNPDFILPGPERPKKGITKVVEVFGDFWHSKLFTGRAPFEHEQELVLAYQGVGLECLVVWESEIKEDPITVRARVVEFLSLPSC